LAELGLGEEGADPRAQQMTTFDLTAAEPAPDGRVRLSTVAAWAGGWTALVLVMAGIVSTQKFVPFAYALKSEAVNYYTLAAASLLVWYAAAHIGAKRWSIGAQAAAHVALGVVVTAAWQSVYAAYMFSVMGPFVWEKLYRGTWMFQMMNASVIYAGVLAGTLAVQGAQRAREHERRQHALVLAAREAELRALNAQLEPHFLLNTLNSVLALVDDRPRDARLMIERLSELLKAAFDEIEEIEVPLGRELDLLHAYLGIEQVRIGDRLRVSIDVPASLRQIAVPPFLLQPLAENAIKHAVAPHTGPAFIAISAHEAAGRVRIDVADSGRGFEYETASRRGHGLQLAERRLKAHAPSGEIGVDRTAAGFAVFVTLPA
jgi:two-component system, LytTR family, sensor kinase